MKILLALLLVLAFSNNVFAACGTSSPEDCKTEAECTGKGIWGSAQGETVKKCMKSSQSDSVCKDIVDRSRTTGETPPVGPSAPGAREAGGAVTK
jgi:hypothetical protein